MTPASFRGSKDLPQLPNAFWLAMLRRGEGDHVLPSTHHLGDGRVKARYFLVPSFSRTQGVQLSKWV